jgi:hypothetical protein
MKWRALTTAVGTFTTLLLMNGCSESLKTGGLYSVDDGEGWYRMTGARVPIWRLHMRVVVKSVLGIISFLTLPARRDRRAIHDLAANTLVVEASATK